MKKICFIHYRKNNDGTYYIKDATPKSDFNELIGSFTLFTKFELISFESIDKNTALFISIQSLDFSMPKFLETLKNILLKTSFKKVFFERSF